VSIIARIKEKLLKYPDVKYTSSDSHLEVQPSDGGFSVAIHASDGKHTVAFEGWHEHFDDEDTALECFAWGLSDECRLEVSYRGAFPTSWTVQSLQDGEWVSDSTTGLLFIPFWRRRTVRHLQNAVLSRGAAT
jgi:hypothetical protein